MNEEFSKLSLRSKSIITSQTMNWTIPQSRLDQHCPFLERDFPYFTTDFSFLHFSSSDLELKWRLVLEKKGEFVTINLFNTNDGSVFERKEMRNVELRWTLVHQLSQQTEHSPEISFVDEFPAVLVDFQTLRFGTPKGFPLCKVEDFDSFASNGQFTFDIKIYLEFFQEKKKFSIIQQAKKLSDSISEISTIYSRSNKSRSSVMSTNRNSVQSNSWVGKTLPNFVANSLSRKSSFSKPTYQSSRPPSPPRLPCHQTSPAPERGRCAGEYQYQQPVYSQPRAAFSPFSQSVSKQVECDPGRVSTLLSVQSNDGNIFLDLIRRTKSGRLPSVVEQLSRADDSLDSVISGPHTDTVFITPLRHSTANSREVKTMFKGLSVSQPQHVSISSLSACRARPQLASTPQSQPLYANSPAGRSNSLYVSGKHLAGRSPRQVKTDRPGLSQHEVLPYGDKVCVI